jgi:hypothetical protein
MAWGRSSAAGWQTSTTPVASSSSSRCGTSVGSSASGWRGAGLVELDELVGFEAEHFAEVGAPVRSTGAGNRLQLGAVAIEMLVLPASC